MPLKRSGSHGALQENIREMMKSGHNHKQAVAAALSNQRKYKHMAEGGEVEMEGSPMDLHEEAAMRSQAQGSVDSMSDEGEAGEPINPIQNDPVGLSQKTMDQEMLAKAIQAAGQRSNDNTHDFEPDDSVAGTEMSEGGLVVDQANNMVGNKPDAEWIDDGTEQPMSSMPMKPASAEHAPAMPGMVSPSGLSEEAKRAIAAKRAKRKYGQFDPK